MGREQGGKGMRGVEGRKGKERNDVLCFTFTEEKERTGIQWNRISQVLNAQVHDLEQ